MPRPLRRRARPARARLPVAVALAASAAHGACGAPPTPPQRPARVRENPVLAPGHVFEVRVWGRADLDARCRVEADGTTSFAHAGRMRTAGLTPDALSGALAARLHALGVERNARVRVRVVEIDRRGSDAGSVPAPTDGGAAPDASTADATPDALTATPAPDPHAAPRQQIAALHPPDAHLTLCNVRVVAVELDAAPPAETAVAAERCDEHQRPLESLLWVFGLGPDGAPRSLGRLAWPIDRYAEGFYDGPAGFAELAAAPLLAGGREALSVEHVDMRGGHDPRYYLRSRALVALVDGRVARVFACDVEQVTVAGPARAEVHRVSREVTTAPGALRVRLGRRAVDYRFDGRRFVPRGADLCAAPAR